MFIRSLLCGIALLTGCVALDGNQPPATTTDGLQLIDNRNFEVLYIRPNSDFSRYDSVFIAAPTIEFASDWQRRQNISDPHRVTDRDMEKIRAMVSAQVVEVFTQELAEGTNYKIVDTPESAALILSPAIVDLDIINPLNNQSYRITVLAENSGSMTMNMELRDAQSNEAVLRLTDKNRGRDHNDFHRQDSVRLRSENNRTFRAWAKSLNEILSQNNSPG